jgi:hypothetical protein
MRAGFVDRLGERRLRFRLIYRRVGCRIYNDVGGEGANRPDNSGWLSQVEIGPAK